MNKFTNATGKFIKKICKGLSQLSSIILNLLPYLIIVLILFAACNHITVNNVIKSENKCDNPSLTAIDTTNVDTIFIRENIRCTQITSSTYESGNTQSSNDIKKEIEKEKIKKYFLDANAITYLVTLIVALVLSLVIATQKDIRVEIKQYSAELQKYKDLLPEIKNGNNLYIRVESIYIESCILKQSLSVNSLTLDSKNIEIVYCMDRKTRSIISIIPKMNITKIHDELEWEIVATIDNAINNINIERIRTANPGNTDYIEEMYANLEHLKNILVNINIADS